MLTHPPVLTLSGEPLACTGDELGAPLLPLFDTPAFIPKGPGIPHPADHTLLLWEEGLCDDPDYGKSGVCPLTLDWRLTPRPEYSKNWRYLSRADRYFMMRDKIIPRLKQCARMCEGDEAKQLHRIHEALALSWQTLDTHQGIPENPALRRSSHCWLDLIWRKRNLGDARYRVRQVRERLYRSPRGQRLVFRVGLPIRSLEVYHRYRNATRSRIEANRLLADIRRAFAGRVFWPFRDAQVHAQIITGVFSHSTLVFAVALPDPVEMPLLQAHIMDRLREVCEEPDLGIQFADSQDYLRQFDVWSHPFVDGDPVEIATEYFQPDQLIDYLLAERGEGRQGQPRCFNSRGILAPRTRRARRYPCEDKPARAAEVRAHYRRAASRLPGGVVTLWLLVALHHVRTITRALRWISRHRPLTGRQLELPFVAGATGF